MKFVSFSARGQTRIGAIQGDRVADLTARLGVGDMIALMEIWASRRRDVETAVAATRGEVALEGLALSPPVARPGKIFAIGLNYADHCAEGGLPVPQTQTWFSKAPSAVNGPYDALELPAVSEQLDYEAEMVVVIGRRCRNVPKARAAEVIFGYCVGNDVSVRDWQLLTPQWSLGKSFDRSAPFGPSITTSDSVDPHALGIRSYVNGEKRQESNTKHLVFSAFDMVAYLSQAMTLEPGDLIFTGTPSGVGLHWPNGPAFLKTGDVVRVEIDELGAIENRVEAGSDQTLIS